ncbi:MAG: hypothetical protein ACR2OO_16290 [Thermomicrobiales bacterium]
MVSVGSGMTRQSARVPETLRCDECGVPLAEPFGWCFGCRAGFCLACGPAHFCTPGCPSAGCIAGLCVRLVADGRVSERWGLPISPTPDRSSSTD